MATVSAKSKDINAYNAYFRKYMAAKRAVGRDLDSIRDPKNPERRRAATESFAEFCRTYFPEQFTLPWSPYHFRMAEKIERALGEGGFFAFAMPRGSGKTSICRWGVLWTVLCGKCDYVVLVGASEDAAKKQLANIRTSLARNPLLDEDFPEATMPIRYMVENSIRPDKLTYRGQATHIEWSKRRIVMPWIPLEREFNSGSRGAVIEIFGMTAEIRGLSHTKPDETNVRPSLALVDDPQTRESAKSPSQSLFRLETLAADIAYLAGPDKAISIVCPCTVIYSGDMADQLLNREVNPEWQGERTKMVEAFPSNMELWDQYADVLRQSFKEDGDRKAANKFYAANREAMDVGAVVTWEGRYKKSELSAIQHAMNFKIRNEAAFYAECQNEPIQQQDDLELLSPEKIAAKVTGYDRRVVPDECSVITAFTDVQKEHLFWMVCGWTPDFTGYVLDYGAWPDQQRNYFTRRDVRKKLSTTYPGDESGQMFGALTELCLKLTQPYRTHSGRSMSLGRWCIDGNWRTRTAAVESFAKQSEFASIITITQGRGVKASENPFSQAVRAIRWKTGPGWFWQDGPGRARWVTFDANLWKTRIHQGLTLAKESRGSIQLFKAPPHVHQMLGDHLRAEKPVKNESNGRTVYEWQERPGQDNEGLDALVGCAVGASIEKIQRASERPPKPKERISLASLQKK